MTEAIIQKSLLNNTLSNDNMSVKSNYKKSEKTFLIFSIFCIFINLLFYDNIIIGYGFAILESLILLYLLFVKKDYADFFCYFLVILASSLEYAFFVVTETGELYNFKNFRILGLNLGLIFIVLGLLALLFNSRFSIFGNRKIVSNENNGFIKAILFLIVTSIIFGLINIAINDNNIRNMEGYAIAFINNAYLISWLFFLMVFIVNLLMIYHKTDKIKKIAESIIWVIFLNSMISLILAFFGVRGAYGSKEMMLSSAATSYAPLLLLLPFYFKSKRNIFFAFSIAIFIALGTMFYSYAGGKTIILIGVSLIIFLIMSIKKSKTPLIPLALTLVGVLGVMAILPVAIANSQLFGEKFYEVETLLQFWRPNWYENMASSSKFRITEFINIFAEYAKKPQYILFGKGFIGTIIDITGNFYPHGWATGGFTFEEFTNQAYYSVHETVSVLLLRCGLAGMIFFFYFFIKLFKKLLDNIFVIIGLVWFMLYLDYSLTLGIIGLPALLLGFYLSHQNKLAKTEKKLLENT